MNDSAILHLRIEEQIPNSNGSNPYPTCKKGGENMMKCENCSDIHCGMGDAGSGERHQPMHDMPKS